MPEVFFGFTSQMVLRASLSCPKTPDAPKTRVTMPMTVAIVPLAGLAAFSTISCTALAASGPRTPRSCVKTWLRAASSPKTSPAMAMAISSSGASEKIV